MTAELLLGMLISGLLAPVGVWVVYRKQLPLKRSIDHYRDLSPGDIMRAQLAKRLEQAAMEIEALEAARAEIRAAVNLETLNAAHITEKLDEVLRTIVQTRLRLLATEEEGIRTLKERILEEISLKHPLPHEADDV
jgi:hypothetical protein